MLLFRSNLLRRSVGDSREYVWYLALPWGQCFRSSVSTGINHGQYNELCFGVTRFMSIGLASAGVIPGLLA